MILIQNLEKLCKARKKRLRLFAVAFLYQKADVVDGPLAVHLPPYKAAVFVQTDIAYLRPLEKFLCQPVIEAFVLHFYLHQLLFIQLPTVARRADRHKIQIILFFLHLFLLSANGDLEQGRGQQGKEYQAADVAVDRCTGYDGAQEIA